MTKSLWKLLAAFLVVAVVADPAWVTLVEKIVLSTGSYPRSLGQIGLWMPGGVGLRIANLFGYRFEVSRWDEMGPFVIITSVLGYLVWGSRLFGFTILVRRVVRSRVQRATA